MKGGRLHRPEPHTHPVAAALPAPVPAPADDWVDDSWTVDCSCGVTFDDGEEMVSCDECSVWVHTRCARYVRGVHTSFSCHNCRSKRAPSSADEAEVAELLAEMPTHRPPPLCRRWGDVPLPSRVHVHGLPGGGDSALFRGAPAFSAALWRSTGYVPKRFGFRYYEFPSWADDKDNGADALFALAREKPREVSDSVLIGGVEPKKEKHYIRSLSCRGKKIDGVTHTLPHLKEAKKREPGIREDRCQQREAVADTVYEDHYVETNMVSSGLQSVKTNNKTEDLFKRSEETKCLKEIPGMPNKAEQKDRLKVEASATEQEVHSVLVGMEVSMRKQQAEVKEGLKSGRVKSGPNEMQDLQKQSNLTSSLEDVDGLPDVHNVQLESQNIKKEPCSQGNDTTIVVQLASDDPKCDKQVLRDTAGSSMTQQNSLTSTYVSLCSEHPKSEAENPMDTVKEHPNSVPGVAKCCKPFSGRICIPCDLPQAVDKELSSTRNTDRLQTKELASPTEIKHDLAKVSEESSQQITRCLEKGQQKGSIASAPKSYRESRIYAPTVRPKLPVSKEQSQKTATTGGTSAKSFHGEGPPLQSRNKAVVSSSSQRKDKINQRTIHITQDGSNNSTSTELRACDSTASLSDEQLALLLHQQLNSSPRVPRVPRCHQVAGSQMLHPPGATVFSKRSSVHGGRDHGTVLKKRNREDMLKDSKDRRTEKVAFVERRQRASSTDDVSSLKDSCRSAENIASQKRNHSVCSTGANSGLTDDTVSRNLPGLIDEIISKNRSITHEELCDAVHQHCKDLRKPNEEDCTFPTLLRSINDCLRKKREWAHLVDQASKTYSNKRQKRESNSLLDDMLQAEKMGPERDSEEGSTDFVAEDLPRGRQKAKKRRRLELKGRRVRDTRKRSSIDSSPEEATAILSDSSSDRNDTPTDDVNQEDYSVAPRTESYKEGKDADPSS